MDDIAQSRVASAITIVFGVWLLVSPIFINLTGGALVSTLITGAIVAIAGVVQLFWENTIPSWVNGLAAVWLLIATIVFGMTGAQVWSELVSAIVIFVAATWDGIEVDQVHQRHVHAAR